jgi:stress-induced morphogen
MIDLQHVFKVLTNSFPDSEIKVNGFSELQEHYRPTGRTGNHLKIDVTSNLFEGRTLLEQHKMVHNSLEKLMQMNGGFIHAVIIKTRMEQE